MPSDRHLPTDDEVRYPYIAHRTPLVAAEQASQEFSDWLAAHDARVRAEAAAQALRDAADEFRRQGAADLASGDLGGASTNSALYLALTARADTIAQEDRP